MATSISNKQNNLIDSSGSRTDENLYEENVLRNPNVFLLIKPEGKLTSVNPFLIDKSLRAIAGGSLKLVKKLRTGELLVETENSKQAERLLKSKKLANVPVNTTIHRALNTCKGVITVDELLDVPDADILEGLRDKFVSHVKRIHIRKDGVFQPTKSIIVTFALRKVPASIKVGYLNCPVRTYVPNPLRCFKCQKYGHSQPSCMGSLVCARCSEKGHDSKDCKEQYKCPNCSGSHASYSRECEVWKNEKSVQKYRVENDVSYLEAKKQMRRPGVLPTSYAEKAKVKQSSISVQTDAIVDSDLDKEIETKVSALVNKALENLLTNLVRICGNAMPAEILKNPRILLEPQACH